jgi:hypothetical protein
VAEVERLQQTASAAVWAADAMRLSGRRWGSYASDAEWRSVVNRRRDAAAPQGLFLTELLHTLREAVGQVMACTRVHVYRQCAHGCAIYCQHSAMCAARVVHCQQLDIQFLTCCCCVPAH